MHRRLLSFALTLAVFCPLAAFAQTPPPAPAVPSPAAPPSTDPVPAVKKHPHVNGKISAVDAAAKTITLSHGRKTIVVSVPDTAKIYKPSDAKGQPTGTFADLTVDTRVNVNTAGDETAPVAKSVHIRAPKTTGDVPTAPVVP